MNRNRNWQIAALGVAVGALVTVAILGPRAKKPAKPVTPGMAATKEMAKANVSFNKPEAKKVYSDFVEKYKASPDKQVQDQVGAARIRLAYAMTRAQDWEQARKVFKEAAVEYRGTDVMSADFGGIKDQATYQAAVCLSAEGKKAEARAAFVDFIKTQPLSPLVNAAYKRLVKMDSETDGRDAHGTDDALIQSALNKQEKQIKFEISVCGPKAILKLLEVLHVPAVAGTGNISHPLPPPSKTTTLRDGVEMDYKAVAKLCGTTDDGTTVDGMRKALHSFGLDYYGFQVGREDFAKIATPALMLRDEHYFVVLSVKGQTLNLYDPVYEREIPLDFAKLPPEKAGAILLLPQAPLGN